MSTLHEFDIRSKGCAALMESWKARHEELAGVWKIEDLVCEYAGILQLAIELSTTYRIDGFFPNVDVGLKYFATTLKDLLDATKELDEQAGRVTEAGFDVLGAFELRERFHFLTIFLDQAREALSTTDRVDQVRANEASDWQRFERIWPSNEELAELDTALPREMFQEDWRSP